MPDCQKLRPGQTYEGRQGFSYFEGIARETTGSQAICMHLLTIPPGGRAKAHKHAPHETASFVLEGRFILETMIERARYPLRSVLLLPSRLQPLSDVLSGLPEDVPVYIAESRILEAVTGFDVHRGVLGCGSALPLFDMPDLQTMNTVLVLSGIANPENIGACFRNAAALGADAVLLDERCSWPLMRRAIRVSMGATLALPWRQDGDIATILSDLERADYRVLALTPSGTTTLNSITPRPRTALILGEEAHGLDIEVLAATQTVAIPMANGTDSLNVATAGAIALHAILGRS